MCLLIWLRWFVAICCLLGGGLCYCCCWLICLFVWLAFVGCVVCAPAGLYGDCLACEFGLGGYGFGLVVVGWCFLGRFVLSLFGC